MSYSYGTDRIGYVKLNGVRVWEGAWPGILVKDRIPHNRGVNIVLIDPITCATQESSNFDTWASSTAASKLSSYLQQLSDGAVIVGLSGDDAKRYLAGALPTLQQLGVDVGDVESRGTFAFVAQKGYPAKTVQRKVLTEAESVSDPAQFFAQISGTCI